MKWAVAVLALSLVACPGPRKEDYSDRSTTQPQTGTKTSPMNPAVPPQIELPTRRAGPAANQIIDVQLSEYQIRMPNSLNAGTYTFNVSNAGHEDHSFVIEGNGGHLGFGEALKRGDTRTLDVELKPGTYNVYCPMDKHRGKGMSVALVVR